MKAINNILLLIAVLAFVSCSGNTDNEESSLSIMADKTEIYADGHDKVSFTVKYGSEDVSRSKDMRLLYEKAGAAKEMAAGVNTFTTSEAGTYTFSAQYNNGQQILDSKKIQVTVKEAASLTGYYRKMLAMGFTSIHCTYCPILAQSIGNIRKAYPGRIIPTSFHCDNMGSDPMTLALNGKLYDRIRNQNDGGLPIFAFDLRKSSRDIVNEYAKIEDELKLQLNLYPAVCGVAISSKYDQTSRKLDVTGKFKTDIPGEYRCHLFLVEDGIEYSQMGHEGSSPYIHNYVVRSIASDNVFGIKLNKGSALEAGVEYTYSRSFTLDQDWKSENVRIIACMLKDDGESDFHINNSNECICGGSVGYLYDE